MESAGPGKGLPARDELRQLIYRLDPAGRFAETVFRSEGDDNQNDGGAR